MTFCFASRFDFGLWPKSLLAGFVISVLAACGSVERPTPIASEASYFSTAASGAAVPVLAPGSPRLLTEPFLQNPSQHGVYVVWVTNFAGGSHRVLLEAEPELQASENEATVIPPDNTKPVAAESSKLQRLLEDEATRWDNPPSKVVRREAYRHQAYVTGLLPGKRYRYWVSSEDNQGSVHRAGPFTLQALPPPKKSLQILLTSDQQERFNSLANYQAVAKAFPELDAIFFAGDMVNHPRRGSEWFDNHLTSWLENPTQARPSFFPAMQATFPKAVPASPYSGGQLLQRVPLFPAIANHEVSGRFRPNQSVAVNGVKTTLNINAMFADAQPRWYAALGYESVANAVNPENNPAVKTQWIRDHSHDFDVYRELFTLPDDGPEGEAYYSKRFGDVFLISLNVARIWRNWETTSKSKFSESAQDINNPDQWGFGEHIFTPFEKGSVQYQWLRDVLASDEFKTSPYRVVMFHQSASGLGDNVLPVLTNPIMSVDYRTDTGAIKTVEVNMPQQPQLRGKIWREQVQPLLGRIVDVRYEYPLQEDYFHRDIEPMLQAAGVQLVLHGHSHIWNRVKVGNMHLLETSAAGNCYGAYWATGDGSVWQGALRGSDSFYQHADTQKYNLDNYPRVNDPHGRQPVMPNLSNPMKDFGLAKVDVPFVCSNKISTFSILDTGLGAVRSFAVDVTKPGSRIVEFDRFLLQPQ